MTTKKEIEKKVPAKTAVKKTIHAEKEITVEKKVPAKTKEVKTVVKATKTEKPKTKVAKKTSVKKVDKSHFNCTDSTYSTGKRKEAIAKVWLKEGTGKFFINGKSIEDFVQKKLNSQVAIKRPFVVTSTLAKFDIRSDVSGGGFSAQSEAIMYGISKALVKLNEEFRIPLRAAGLMTSDARKVEEKKFGHRKARRSEQFSKR